MNYCTLCNRELQITERNLCADCEAKLTASPETRKHYLEEPLPPAKRGWPEPEPEKDAAASKAQVA